MADQVEMKGSCRGCAERPNLASGATNLDLVNAEIARVAAGWEPFATLTQPGGWVLLLKRHADTA